MKTTTQLAAQLGSVSPSHGGWVELADVEDAAIVPDRSPLPNWYAAADELSSIARRWRQRPTASRRLWQQWSAQHPALSNASPTSRFQLPDDKDVVRALILLARQDADAFECFVAKGIALLWRRGHWRAQCDAASLWFAIHHVDIESVEPEALFITVQRRAQRVFYRATKRREGANINLVRQRQDVASDLAGLLALDLQANVIDTDQWGEVVGFYCNHIPKGLTHIRRRERRRRAKFARLRQTPKPTL